MKHQLYLLAKRVDDEMRAIHNMPIGVIKHDHIIITGIGYQIINSSTDVYAQRLAEMIRQRLPKATIDDLLDDDRIFAQIPTWERAPVIHKPRKRQ